MTRDDLKRFRSLDIDFCALDLSDGGPDFEYFCTPVGAECVGCLGWDGIHFVILPGDERVFCVDPWGREGEYVLPVGQDFREFLSFVLYCQGASSLSLFYHMTEDQFRHSLKEISDGRRSGEDPEFWARLDAILDVVAREFDLAPADPFEKVKTLQAGFDPSALHFSDEYYDVLGLERPE